MHLYKNFVFILVIGLCNKVMAVDFIEEPGVDKNLTNKVILVTGASGDIGRGISTKMLEETDASLVLHYGRNKESLNLLHEKYEDRVYLLSADFSNPENSLPFFKAAKEWKGKIDIVINSCGVEKETNSINETLEITLSTFNINYFSPRMICEYAIDEYQKQKLPGIIINLGSRAAYRGLSQELFHYSDSKAALHRYTQQVAKFYAKSSILAYILAPGPVEGNMLNNNSSQLKQEAIDSMPTGKVVGVEEIADMTLYLAQRKMPSGTGGVLDFMGASFTH